LLKARDEEPVIGEAQAEVGAPDPGGGSIDRDFVQQRLDVGVVCFHCALPITA
jgi:hypothetical protein